VTNGARRWLTPAAWVAGVTGALLLLFPYGFPNYDTIYALVWGRELAHGRSPDYGAALPPTPHPLTDLLGLVSTPLGDGAITLTMIVAYLSLALIGFFVYRLGATWFDRWIGAVAAAIVLTRAPFLSNGLRAYIDLPYIALCLAALLIEAGDPRPSVANGRDNAALAAGALQGRRNGCDRERAHAHTIRCLRTSGRSRSLAGPACMISPRSMM